MPREAAPAADEEPKTEERGWGGGFEDYLEQPVLSPNVEETLPTQNRAERGKRRAGEQESINFELFSLLTEMREKMKRRDEQFREELR